jgi:hypothetical protein
MFNLFRKKRFSDEDQAKFVDAIANMLRIQLIPVGDRSVETDDGLNKKAVGYVYGFIDAALRTIGQDMGDESLGVPIAWQVFRKVFPGKEARCVEFLVQNLADDEVAMCGVMNGGQQYMDFNNGKLKTPMGLARCIIEADSQNGAICEQAVAREGNKIEDLPVGWKHTLKQCNMTLARRELAEFFQMANRTAEAQGQQAVFKTEFVNGWNEFADNPCYKTAAAWLENAPEAASMIFEYFQGSCPGGHLHRAGSKTAMSFSLGNYSLDMPLASLGDLTELTEEEYVHFPRQFRGEAIYHAQCANFVGHHWDMMIGMINKEVYKFGASLEINDQRQAVEVIQAAFKACEVQLGTPTEEKQGLFAWDTPDGNVILQTASIMGSVAVNIYATSRAVRGKPRC